MYDNCPKCRKEVKRTVTVTVTEVCIDNTCQWGEVSHPDPEELYKQKSTN